jgi:hypothetical protein
MRIQPTLLGRGVVGLCVVVSTGLQATTTDPCPRDLLGNPVSCFQEEINDHDDEQYASGTTYGPPPVGDVLREWITAHLIFPELPNALSSDTTMLAALTTKGAPYVSLNTYTNLFGDDAGKTARTLLATVRTPMSRAGAVTAMAWDLGLTSAIHWTTARKPAVKQPANRHARASMIKAGVEYSIYAQARRLVGDGSVVVMAHLALAMQSLKARLARLHDPAAVAVSQGVLDRVVAATSASDVSDSDLDALMRELETVLAAWPGGEASVLGKRQLPAVLRLARLAAAYAAEDRPGDAEGLCDKNGRPTVAAHPEGGELCIEAASDRAVAVWYASRHRLEITQWRTGPDLDTAHVRLVDAVDSVLPFWIGAFSTSTRLAPVSTELVTQWVATHSRDAALYPEPSTAAMFAAATRQLCAAGVP